MSSLKPNTSVSGQVESRIPDGISFIKMNFLYIPILFYKTSGYFFVLVVLVLLKSETREV